MSLTLDPNEVVGEVTVSPYGTGTGQYDRVVMVVDNMTMDEVQVGGTEEDDGIQYYYASRF
jgi:hypothetical protein